VTFSVVAHKDVLANSIQLEVEGQRMQDLHYSLLFEKISASSRGCAERSANT